jgi:hypothetical protein
MELKTLFLEDKPVFDSFLKNNRHSLSTYHFSSIFIWRGLYEILWQEIKGCLCVFLKDNLGCFMHLPPLGNSMELNVIETCFKIMDGYNTNKDVSRIENVGEKDLGYFKKSGYAYYEKPGDYLALRKDLTGLKGNRYKSKRWAYNYFVSNYSAEIQPLSSRDKDAALSLYENWMRERKEKFREPLYQKMLEDNSCAQKEALENFEGLGLSGLSIRIDGKLCAYTFGFKLNPDTFCVLSETCDLSYKGISAFIFRRFCRELEGFKYINIMDDSGLENLKEVKLSYYPEKIIPNYIVVRYRC